MAYNLEITPPASPADSWFKAIQNTYPLARSCVLHFSITTIKCWAVVLGLQEDGSYYMVGIDENSTVYVWQYDGSTLNKLYSASIWTNFSSVNNYVTVAFRKIQFGDSKTPTITAYHPDNDNHELRIPEGAKPFDSGDPPYGKSGVAFSVKFDMEGTYDYFTRWEEWRGMVGRIVVGKPGGPGEKPWGYGNKEGRKVVPPEVLKRVKLMDSQEIVKKKAIPFPYLDEEYWSKYPQW